MRCRGGKRQITEDSVELIETSSADESHSSAVVAEEALQQSKQAGIRGDEVGIRFYVEQGPVDIQEPCPVAVGGVWQRGAVHPFGSRLPFWRKSAKTLQALRTAGSKSTICQAFVFCKIGLQ
jgi:hypothetical protein